MRHIWFRLQWLRFLPVKWWLTTACISLVCAYMVGHTLTQAKNEQGRFGLSIEAPVAIHQIDAGSTITETDFHLLQWPRSLLPASPISPMLIGSVVTQTILPGQPIVSGDLAPAGLSAAAALLKSDERGIDFPNDSNSTQSPPNVRVGDQVELILTENQSGGTGAIPGRVVATQPSLVTVAIKENEVGRIAMALKDRNVIIALAPPE